MSGRAHPVGGFVLVGGRSRRMGRNKAWLRWDGRPLFLRAADCLRGYVAEVRLLGPAETYSGFGFPVLPDRQPGRGPLEAVCTGLRHSPYEWNLFLACDLPRVEGRWLERLVESAGRGRADAVVPRVGGRWQPLCAAYHRRCLPAFERALEESGGRLLSALARVRVEALGRGGLAEDEEGERIFANVNTPQEWARVRLSGGGQLG